jgi:hypothetical protein
MKVLAYPYLNRCREVAGLNELIVFRPAPADGRRSTEDVGQRFAEHHLLGLFNG